MFHFIAAALILSVSALPDNWVHFANCGESGQLRTYYYDSSSVKANGSRITARIVADYSQDRSSRAKTSNLAWDIDCQAGTFVERSRRDIGARGKVIRHYNYPTMTMRIGAGSVADSLAQRLCPAVRA